MASRRSTVDGEGNVGSLRGKPPTFDEGLKLVFILTVPGRSDERRSYTTMSAAAPATATWSIAPNVGGALL